MDRVAGIGFAVFTAIAPTACGDPAGPGKPTPVPDAASDASNDSVELDAGSDASSARAPLDAGSDSGGSSRPRLDAGSDSGTPRPPDCDAGPARWLTEGDVLNVQLEVTCNAQLVDSERVRFRALPTGASYDRDSGRLSWTPELDQAAVYELDFTVTKSSGRGRVRVGVADAFDDPDNTPITDPLQYPYEYGLPVFFLEDPEHENYHPSSLVYAGRHYPSIEIKLRGQTSREYPKNSYTLKFPDDDRFDELDFGGGLTLRKKLVLTTTFDDNTYVRQRLAHVMWGLLDADHVAVRSYNAVVYRDGQYRGVYAVSDHIDRHLMQAHGLFISGELFKSRTHAGDFLNTAHDMEKTEGHPDHGSPGWDDSLQELIGFVRDSSAAEFGEQLPDYVAVGDYQNWWVFTTFVAATDSAAKNAYHYRETPDSPFRVVPWDFNASFGQDWRTLRAEGRTKYLARNGLWARMAADDDLRAAMLRRAREALDGPYALSDILAHFDRYFSEIEPAAQRDWRYYRDAYRSFPRWAAHRDDFTTPAEEAAYVRHWLTEHWAFLEESLPQLLVAD